jgi:ABC-type lipoprotein export system ATPase subunit
MTVICVLGGFEGLVTNQWEEYSTDDNPATGDGNGNVLAYYGFEGFNKWFSLWILALYVIVTMLCTYVALRPRNRTLVYVPEGIAKSSGKTRKDDIGNPLHDQQQDDASLTVPLMNGQHAHCETGSSLGAGSTSWLADMQGEISVYSWKCHLIYKVSSADDSVRSIGYHVLFRNVNYVVNNNALINETSLTRIGRLWRQNSSPETDRPPLTTTEKEKSFNSYGESAGEVYNVIGNIHNDECYRGSSASAFGTVQLLHNVYGEARPGEMVALMGSSGAGKSTLLDVLANRKTTGTITGEINVFTGTEKEGGGYHYRPEEAEIATLSAYVMQDNVHIGILTVRETLYFAAELRLNETWNLAMKKRRVDKVIAMLGLDHVQDTIVGTDLQRGISGGQLKRLSIGVEIINLPGKLQFYGY